MIERDPHDLIRQWLPHILVIVVLGLGVWLLAIVFHPVVEPILLASALALLTTHILYHPIDHLLLRVAPWCRERWRRRIAGVLAAVVLVAVLLTPMFLILASTIGSVSGVVELLWGLLTNDDAQFKKLEEVIQSQITSFEALYPVFELNKQEVAKSLVADMRAATNFGKTMMSFIFAGTGALAQLVLALVTLAFLYPQGPQLVHGLLRLSPLDDSQCDQLMRRHRQVVLRLLNDTVAMAVVKGIVLGLIAWLVDTFIGSGALPIIPFAVMAGLITLLPFVGVTMAWLPLAGLFWSAGHWQAAVVLAIAVMVANALIEWLHHRIGKHLDDRGEWMGFLLFLGLVGGLLSFGLKGFIIGPMAVVLVYTLGSFWLPLYGLGDGRAWSGTQALSTLGEQSDAEQTGADDKA